MPLPLPQTFLSYLRKKYTEIYMYDLQTSLPDPLHLLLLPPTHLSPTCRPPWLTRLIACTHP